MVYRIQVLFAITGLMLALLLSVAIDSCMGQRNCVSSVSTSMFWATLISLPFWLSAFYLADMRPLGYAIRAGSLLVMSAYAYLAVLPAGSLFGIRLLMYVARKILSGEISPLTILFAIFYLPIVLGLICFFLLAAYVAADAWRWFSMRRETE